MHIIDRKNFKLKDIHTVPFIDTKFMDIVSVNENKKINPFDVFPFFTRIQIKLHVVIDIFSL